MIESSKKQNIFFSFLVWHFVDAPKEVFKIWANFLVFSLKYFSVGILLKTFFRHFRNFKEDYGRGFDAKRYSMVFLGNMISRVIGAFVRLILIIIGLLFFVFVLLLGLIVFVLWLLAPFLVLALIYAGVILLFSNSSVQELVSLL